MAYRSKYTGADIEQMLDESKEAVAEARSAAEEASGKALEAEAKAKVAEDAAEEASVAAREAQVAALGAIDATTDVQNAIDEAKRAMQEAHDAAEKADNATTRAEQVIGEAESATSATLMAIDRANKAADRVEDLIDGKKTEFWKLTQADSSFGVTINKTKTFLKGKYLYKSVVSTPSGYDRATMTYGDKTENLVDGMFFVLDDNMIVNVSISANKMSSTDSFTFFEVKDGLVDRFNEAINSFNTEMALKLKACEEATERANTSVAVDVVDKVNFLTETLGIGYTIVGEHPDINE